MTIMEGKELRIQEELFLNILGEHTIEIVKTSYPVEIIVYNVNKEWLFKYVDYENFNKESYTVVSLQNLYYPIKKIIRAIPFSTLHYFIGKHFKFKNII